jgi:hypothetical protein
MNKGKNTLGRITLVLLVAVGGIAGAAYLVNRAERQLVSDDAARRKRGGRRLPLPG